MARSKRLEIVIAGDASGGVRALGSIEGRLGKVGRSFGRFGRAAAIGIGAVGVAGAAAVIAVGRDLVNMERLLAQTETVIRSTGGAANVSAEDVADLGQAIQDLSGIQQESVMEGANLLLTFRNVANEAGAGNDIFDQATMAMTDMATAMGTDVSSQAIRLGRALNDPTAGLAALTRVGVTFTDQQKDQVEALMESGDLLGAQKIILRELNTEFGGSAAAFGETTAGQFARAKEQLGDMAETIVVRLMPAITTAVKWFREDAIPAIQAFSDWVGPRLTAAFDTVVAWVRANWPQIQTTISNVLTQVQTVVSTAVEFIRTLWAAFGDDIIGHVRRAWPLVQQTIQGVMQVIQGIITTVGAIIRGDWGDIWNGIVQILKGAWRVMVATIRTAINTARTVIGAAWQVIKNLTQGAWEGIKNAVRSGVDGLMSIVRSIPGRIRSVASGMWDSITNGFRAAINAIVGLWNNFSITFGGYDIPGPGPNIPGFTIDTPDIPYLANGGIVTGPTLAMIGEAGPEAVIPLGRGGAGNTVTINIYGDADAQAITKLESAVRRGLSSPQLDRKIRRLAGAR